MPVPGADILADIAAKDPTAESVAELGRHRPAVFNGQRGDALRRVEYPRLGKRIGRAGVEAGGAGAAVVYLKRHVRRQFHTRQQSREKKEAA